MSAQDLKSRAISGSVWAVGGELIAGSARALSYVVYAKLLTPTDFGLLGFSLLFIALFPLVLDNSLGLALMRHPEHDQRVYSTGYYLNVALAVVAIILLCLAAPWTADLIHDHRVTWILRILSIQLLFNALCSVHIAHARRRFSYRRLLPIRFISTVCSLGVGIPLAFAGYAYWALVASSMVAALSQMVAAQFLLEWRPTLQFEPRAARSISGFASWVAVDMAITWMVMSGGAFFLAFYLGTHDLGLFRLSDRIDTYVLGSILGPLIPILYAGFCEVSLQPDASWRMFAQSINTVTPLGLILAGAVIVVALPLQALIGPKWHGVAAVIILNAAADGLSYTTLPAPSLLRAHGMARLVAAMRFVTVIAQIIVYMSVAPHGVIAFLFGKIGLEMGIYLSTFIVLRFAFHKPVLRICGQQLWQAIVISACAMIGLGIAARTESFGTAIELTASLTAFAVPIGIFIVVAHRDLVSTILHRRAPAK